MPADDVSPDDEPEKQPPQTPQPPQAPQTPQPPHYRRVVLKLSGESLVAAGERGINGDEVGQIASQIRQAHATGCQIAVVIGGGNILRGARFSGTNAFVQPATAHYMGMLATVINSLAMQDALEQVGCQTRVMSAVRVDNVAESFIRRRALRHLEKGRVIILAGGTGNPFVTTDTAAAQRALELDADVVLKATRVDGVYSHDPELNPHAVLYDSLSYADVLEKNLKVMDGTAITLCQEHAKPILVFNFKRDGNIVRAVSGDTVGTWIGPKRPANSRTEKEV